MAKRLARLALARDYGYEIPHLSPRYKSMEREGNRIRLSFDHAGSRLHTFDVREALGFTISGEDRKFHHAQARVVGDAQDRIEVWSDAVSDPVAVRYAWADNPVCNVYSREGLPLTPFRTDDWPALTRDNH